VPLSVTKWYQSKLFELRHRASNQHSSVFSVSHARIHFTAWPFSILTYTVTRDRLKHSDFRRIFEITFCFSCFCILLRMWRIEVVKFWARTRSSVPRWFEVNRYSMWSGYCNTVKAVTVSPPLLVSHNWASLLTKLWKVCSGDCVMSDDESRELEAFLLYLWLRTSSRTMGS